MKKCPKCGRSYEDNNKFCTKCGVPLFADETNTPSQKEIVSYSKTNFNDKVIITAQRVKPRSVAKALIFTILSCGLYGLYWLVAITDEMDILVNRKNGTGGLMSLIFTILTCGLYGLFWAYKLGDNVDFIKGNRGGNTGILYLILYIFLFGLIDLALAQDVINDKLEGFY
ncbi:MAG: DUF4234 domain-containing protein [Acidaminococcaceae bacterium]|nr:DUF4234 domain-containing protein [Acidaminococcaceae bacterium]